MYGRKLTIATLLLLAVFGPHPTNLSGSAAAQPVSSEEHTFRVVRIAEGLEFPWGLAFLPDRRMLIAERPGQLRIVAKNGRLEPQAVAGLPPVAAVGQGGLLDVTLHPRFPENGLVYMKLDGEKVVKEERMLKGVLGRLRDVRTGPDGFLYLLTDSPGGALVRLEPAG
jgi:glucose/arabinose dehydrogenase